MRLKFTAALGAALVLALLGCGQKRDDSAPPSRPDPQATTQQPAPGEAQHADAGVKPGSYEDWCGEHEVPESLCTRCNPDLAAAFKATGDWCAEHGLPESQCKQCNPDLKITRPAKVEGQ
jgi:predicted small lipoprotein YifL